METLIVDASAVLAVLLNEPHREALVRLTMLAELEAPETLPYEVVNALSARMRRRDAFTLSEQEALQAYEYFQSMEISLLPLQPEEYRQAIRLSAAHGLYAYDAYMLVMALRTGAPLVTLDGLGNRRGLLQVAHEIGIETRVPEV